MTVSAQDIATELGRSAPTAVEAAQWGQWIAAVLVLVEARYGARFDELDPDTVDLVVREVVAARARRPDASSSTTVTVDDGSVTRRYEDGESVSWPDLLGPWWSLLDPTDAGQPAGAFTINPFPARLRRCW